MGSSSSTPTIRTAQADFWAAALHYKVEDHSALSGIVQSSAAGRPLIGATG
jgi:hypothetical protein